MKIVAFTGKPDNYGKINDSISRSAQPQKEDFVWLKEQGITDVVNFRTMEKEKIDFNEREVVESLGMKYHNIPSYTRNPSDKNIKRFLSLADKVTNNNGKMHIHCMAGADRTGMYAFIYKTVKNIGTMNENLNEWLDFGHHKNFFPDLVPWTKEYVKRFLK